MRARISSYFTLISIVLLSTLILWVPFILRVDNWLGLNFENQSLLTIYQHFDGLLYIVAAKTLYNPQAIEKIGLEIALAPIYFAAHLPLYPLFILLFSPILGFLKSMVAVNLICTSALAAFFFYFLKTFNLTKKPLLLVVVFLFLPRFLIIRSIGAPESIFILCTLVSVFFFEKEKFWLAGIFGALATMTKSPGILLFAAYGLVFLEKIYLTRKVDWRFSVLTLIPLGLLAVFALYWKQYGDFWAYFNSGDNLHLVSPFAVFNFQKRWVGTAWLEEVIFYFFMYILTVITFKNSRHRSFFYFSLVFLVATSLVDHRDISRYSLPLWAFACIAFEKFFTSKRFLIAGAIILPGIYLYAWNFLLYNVMPVGNWAPFLP